MQKQIEALGAIEGVRGALLVSKDGLVIASSLPDQADHDLYAAVTASLFGTMDRTTERIGIGKAIDSMVQTEDQTLQIMNLADFVLVAITDKRQDIEAVRKGMRRAAREILASASAE